MGCDVVPGTSIPISVQSGGCRSEFHRKFAPDSTRDQMLVHLAPNDIFVLCLGCHVMGFRHPEGLEIPESFSQWINRKELDFVGATMMKRQKMKRCVLCDEARVRRFGGLWFCEQHAEAAERQGI